MGNRTLLSERVAAAAGAILTAQGFVRPIDVLVRIGWLYPGAEKEWQIGRTDTLEQLMQVDASRLAEALTLLRSWAAGQRLIASEADYVARKPERPALRFSRSGDPVIERHYRTHWMRPDLPESRKRKLVEKAKRAPDLVVIMPRNLDWTCHRCGQTGDLLMMEDPGPACMRCVGLADLVFLAAGNTLLTRRAKAKSGRSAVVVRYSRTRGRYERQGLLLEKQALEEAERAIAPGV